MLYLLDVYIFREFDLFNSLKVKVLGLFIIYLFGIDNNVFRNYFRIYILEDGVVEKRDFKF